MRYWATTPRNRGVPRIPTTPTKWPDYAWCDELKNQWGWGGYTTQDIKRSRFAAMMVALIYNGWSLFVRLANPEGRMEAITSRPFLLSGITQKTTHAGQQHLKITPMHGKGEQASAMLTRVSRLLHEWKQIAEQLNLTAVWQQTCQSVHHHCCDRIQRAWATANTHLLTEGIRVIAGFRV